MTTPHCKSCGNTNPVDFYKSINTYCKDHWKAKVKANRESRSDQYQAYERSRAHLPHRIKSRGYSGNGKIGLYCVIPDNHPAYDSSTSIALAWTKRNPSNRSSRSNQHTAHLEYNRALNKGLLVKSDCEICGSSNRICGHHNDYNKPLEVVWMCTACHNKWHRDNGQALNA